MTRNHLPIAPGQRTDRSRQAGHAADGALYRPGTVRVSDAEAIERVRDGWA